MLKHLESIMLFVHDIHAASRWYADIFGAHVQYENPQYAFIRAAGMVIGFHPTDAKCPGGIGGTTAYWEVEDLDRTVAYLQAHGAVLHRGPRRTDFGAGAAARSMQRADACTGYWARGRGPGRGTPR
jgi:predicted enzyme related to lactoylglutathione lyase